MSEAPGTGTGASISDISSRQRLTADEAVARTSPASELSSGGGGGTFGGMSDLFDAKIAAAEARTDTKFAELRGDFRSLIARLEGVEKNTSGLRATIIGTGIAVIAVVLGLLAYGGDRFGAGADISGIIDRAAVRAAEQVIPRQPLGTIDADNKPPIDSQ